MRPLTRAEIEEREERALAPYAMRARATRGRLRPEAEHPRRTAYQRDRDRIVHSRAFRRLQYKSQVFVAGRPSPELGGSGYPPKAGEPPRAFPPRGDVMGGERGGDVMGEENDHYRTRLTHTIEVAQIARSVARTLLLNEDLVEAIALAHDLGHTPFGHTGGEALDECMAAHGGFEHNCQSLRVVDILERRGPEGRPRGLNLSYEVRDAIAKRERFEPDRAPAGPTSCRRSGGPGPPRRARSAPSATTSRA